MAESFSVLILGLTGYIGGSVGADLRQTFPDAKVTAYLRNSKVEDAVKEKGYIPLVGSGEFDKDKSLISKAAQSADVVINTVNADDLDLAKLLLDALRKSHVTRPIYIHTSGTGVVMDKPNGEWQKTAEKVWDDNEVEDIRSIAPEQPHREVDLAIFGAWTDHKIASYIIAPSTIYGVAKSNVGNSISQQVPHLIGAAVEHRQPVYGGKGTNIWNNVHIEDMADLYTLVLRKALKERGDPSSLDPDPCTRFWWASVGQHVWIDLVKALGPILEKKGKVDKTEAKSVPASSLSGAVTTNSVTVSNRGFKDGWQPSRPSIYDTLEEDVDATLAKI